jgi:hypothetical protein
MRALRHPLRGAQQTESESRRQEIVMTDAYFNAPLAEVDPEIAQVLERELAAISR